MLEECLGRFRRLGWQGQTLLMVGTALTLRHTVLSVTLQWRALWHFTENEFTPSRMASEWAD